MAKTVDFATAVATTEFVTTLLNYILDVQLELSLVDFSSNLAWKLVAQLVNHLFLESFDGVRSFVRDSLNIPDKIERAVIVIWGMLKISDLIQEY